MGTITPAAPQETKVAADMALRANVNRLLADWRLDDPNPEAYTAALDTMATTTTGDGLEWRLATRSSSSRSRSRPGHSGPALRRRRMTR